MKVRLTSDQTGPAGPMPAGTEIEHANAFRLLQLGIAEPLDDEAKKAMADHAEHQRKSAERAATMRKQIADQRKAQRHEAFARKLGITEGPENRKIKTK